MQRPRRDEVGLAIGAIGGMVVVVAELTADRCPAKSNSCAGTVFMVPMQSSLPLSSAMPLPAGVLGDAQIMRSDAACFFQSAQAFCQWRGRGVAV